MLGTTGRKELADELTWPYVHVGEPSSHVIGAWPGAETTGREQIFHPMLKWALVPAFFALGARETFSPGWCLQPGLKVDLYSRLEPPTGTKSPPTFSPGW